MNNDFVKLFNYFLYHSQFYFFLSNLILSSILFFLDFQISSNFSLKSEFSVIFFTCGLLIRLIAISQFNYNSLSNKKIFSISRNPFFFASLFFTISFGIKWITYKLMILYVILFLFFNLRFLVYYDKYCKLKFKHEWNEYKNTVSIFPSIIKIFTIYNWYKIFFSKLKKEDFIYFLFIYINIVILFLFSKIQYDS